MICKAHFRLKKNGEPVKNKCFCRHPELIENYDKAIADTNQMWVCHHRLETHNSDGEKRLVSLSMDELKALDMYFDRPSEELIFMTPFEHRSLHTSFRNHENPGTNLGKKFSKEHCEKIGKSQPKNRPKTSALRWWNNGEVAVRSVEQPYGFVLGRGKVKWD